MRSPAAYVFGVVGTVALMQACSSDDDASDPAPQAEAGVASSGGGGSSGFSTPRDSGTGSSGNATDSSPPPADAATDASDASLPPPDGASDAGAAFSWSKDYCAVLDSIIDTDLCGEHWSDVFTFQFTGYLDRQCETGSLVSSIGNPGTYLGRQVPWWVQVFGCTVDGVPPAPPNLSFAPADIGVDNKKWSRIDIELLVESVLGTISYEVNENDYGCTKTGAVDLTPAEKAEVRARLLELGESYIDDALTSHEFSTCGL